MFFLVSLDSCGSCTLDDGPYRQWLPSLERMADGSARYICAVGYISIFIFVFSTPKFGGCQLRVDVTVGDGLLQVSDYRAC